jgi:hypothetical protein
MNGVNLNQFDIANVGLNYAAHNAVAAGYTDLYVPAGTWHAAGAVEVFDFRDPTKGIRMIGAGEARTIIESTSSDYAFTVQGDGAYLADLTVQAMNVMGACVGCPECDMSNSVIERITVRQTPGAQLYNAFTFNWNGGGKCKNVIIRDCTALNPTRMGLELLAQLGISQSVEEFVIEGFRCIRPVGGAAAFNPSISIDGNVINPRIRRFFSSDSTGTSIELIKCTDPDLDDIVMVRPKGSLVGITNNPPVLRPRIKGLRVIDPQFQTVLDLRSAQEAVIEDCDLRNCLIDNKRAVATTISNCQIRSTERFGILNSDQQPGGGGPSLAIFGGLIDVSGYPGLDGCCVGHEVGASGSTLVGSRLVKAPNTPAATGYIGGPGASETTAAAYFKDGIAVLSGL